METNCDILCIQETKKDSFDDSYIRYFCNRSLDKFTLGPSIGASGGFITIWKGAHFDAEVIDEREMCPWAISKCFGDLVSNTSA
jgi:hypothetical protein